jgi:hypothetical protein
VGQEVSELELLQLAGEQAPLTCLVIVLLAREWKAHLAEKRAKTNATLDDLVKAVAQLQSSIESLKGEFRSWFEQRIL